MKYEDRINQPFEKTENPWECLTIGDLLNLGLSLDYKIKFDTFCGSAYKRDLLVDIDSKEISING